MTRAQAIEALERLGREIEVGCQSFEPDRIEAAVRDRGLLLQRCSADPALAGDAQLKTFVLAQGAELAARLRDFQETGQARLAQLSRASELRRGYGGAVAQDRSALDRSG